MFFTGDEAISVFDGSKTFHNKDFVGWVVQGAHFATHVPNRVREEHRECSLRAMHMFLRNPTLTKHFTAETAESVRRKKGERKKHRNGHQGHKGCFSRAASNPVRIVAIPHALTGGEYAISHFLSLSNK